MKLFKPKYKNRKTGKYSQSTKWYVDINIAGERRYIPAFTSKKLSQTFADNIEQLRRYNRAGELPDARLQNWIDSQPEAMLKKFIAWGLITGQRAQSGRLLLDHLEDWKRSMLAGCTEKQAILEYTRVKTVFNKCNFRTFSDISASKVEHKITQLKKTVRKKQNGKVKSVEIGEMTDKTRNYYLQAVQQFMRWAFQDRRIAENPLIHLKPRRAFTEKRVALSPNELGLLLDNTQKSGRALGLDGYQRAILYRFASETGFRAGEIRALKVVDFDFDGLKVTLGGKETKNYKPGTLPLKKQTAQILKDYFGNKLPKAQAFVMPSKYRMATMFRYDAQEAGIELDPDRGLWDFHCLRHTFGTMLAASGVHPKTAQALMRHSNISLTMDLYTHSLPDLEATAINSLPNFDLSIPKAGIVG